jgi:hypothetical protein
MMMAQGVTGTIGNISNGSAEIEQAESDISRAQSSTWRYNPLWADDEHLNDLIVTDIVPSLPGDEIITVGDNYYVTLISGNGDSWEPQRIFKDDFHMKSIAVGDFYPDNPGPELAVAGFTAYVTMLYYDETLEGWYSEQIYEDYDLLHDVAVGDIDPSHPGDEIVTVGESRRLSYIYYDYSSNTWDSEIIWRDKDFLNIVSLGELDETVSGSEIVVTGGSFDVTSFAGREGSWSSEQLWNDGTFINEIEIANLDSLSSTDEIFVMGFSKSFTMLSRNETDAWEPLSIGPTKVIINDVIMDDFSSEYEGSELLAVEASGKVIMIFNNGTEWLNQTIYTLSNSPGKIVMGDFDLYHSGKELAMLEFKGRLTGLYLELHDFGLLTPLEEITMLPGETLQLDILVISNGGFSELVFLNIENIITQFETDNGDNSNISFSQYIDIEFETTAIVPTDFAAATISLEEDVPEGNVLLIFVGASKAIRHFINVTVNIIEDPSRAESSYKGINLALEPRVSFVVQNYYTNFLTNLLMDFEESDKNPTMESAILSLTNAPFGIELQKDPKAAVMAENLTKHLLTLRADTNVPTGSYYLFINAEVYITIPEYPTDLKLERARILKLIIEPLDTSDFVIEISPGRDKKLLLGDQFSWTLGLNTIAGFDDTIQVDFENSNPALGLNLETSTLKPPAEIQLTAGAPEDLEISRNYIIIITNFIDRYRFEIITVDIVPFIPDFNLTINPAGVMIKQGATARTTITLEAEHGFEDWINIELFYETGGHIKWPEFHRLIFLNDSESIEMAIQNLTEPGSYNFTISAEASDEISKSVSFNVDVLIYTKPLNNSEGEDVPEPVFGINQSEWLIIGIVIVIILVLIGLMYIRASRAHGKEQHAVTKDTIKKPAGPRPRKEPEIPQKKYRVPSRLKEELPVGGDKIVTGAGMRTASDDKGHYELGERIFKPGGDHEYDELAGDPKGTKKVKK